MGAAASSIAGHVRGHVSKAMHQETGLRAGKALTPIFSIGRAGAFVLLALFLCALAPNAALAQTAPPLPMPQSPSLPADGSYLAGDYRFAIDRSGDVERLRFAVDDEIFYLSIEPAPLGGRMLKYDTGEVVLQVTGWGGITLYTAQRPNGLPAERTGDAGGLEPPPVIPGDEVKTFAVRASDEIRQHTGLTIGFKADWDAFARSDAMRALACESITNVARAIESVASSHKAREALNAKFNVVRIAASNTQGVALGDKLLTITFAPSRGAVGRPSSLAIIKAIR